MADSAYVVKPTPSRCAYGSLMMKKDITLQHSTSPILDYCTY